MDSYSQQIFVARKSGKTKSGRIYNLLCDDMNKRLLVVFFLGFSSGLPLALVSSTLQAWFSVTGMSLALTGMLSLLSLPYMYRMFLGPIVDRFTLSSLGRRRSWCACMQILLLVGFNVMAWLSPNSSPILIITLAFFLACFSATQDLVIDAQRTEYLVPTQYGMGVSLAVTGYRLAVLTSGGFALVLAEYYGWAATYRIMGCLMAVGLVTTLCSAEPIRNTGSIPRHTRNTFGSAIRALLARQQVWALLLFIFFYKLGEAFTTTTSGIVIPFLIQGIGFSLDTVGYVNKVMGVGALITGGLVAGILLIRCQLYYALLIFGLLQALANLLFVALATGGKQLFLLCIAIASDNFAAGMASTALVVLCMRVVDREFTATQLSLLIALATIPRILSGPVAVTLQSWLGWSGLYQFAFVTALAFIPFLLVLRKGLLATANESIALNAEQISAPLHIS